PLFSTATKPPTTVVTFKFFNFFKDSLGNFFQYPLSNPVTRIDNEIIFTMVDEYDTNFVKIAIIHSTWGIHHRNSCFQCQTGTGPDLQFVPIGNLHSQTSSNQTSFTRVNNNGFFQTSMKVKSSSTFGLILRDNSFRVQFLHFDRDLFHSDSSSHCFFLTFFRRCFCHFSFKSYSNPP